MKLSLYVDGASRGNPGPSGVGILIRDGKKTVKEIFKYIGRTTNNLAEYSALLYALEEALILRADEVAVYVDSELVAKQLSGEYRVKATDLKPLFERALNMLNSFKAYSVTHIDREKNKEADRLANKAINLGSVL